MLTVWKECVLSVGAQMAFGGVQMAKQGQTETVPPGAVPPVVKQCAFGPNMNARGTLQVFIVV